MEIPIPVYEHADELIEDLESYLSSETHDAELLRKHMRRIAEMAPAKYMIFFLMQFHQNGCKFPDRLCD